MPVIVFVLFIVVAMVGGYYEGKKDRTGFVEDQETGLMVCLNCGSLHSSGVLEEG